MSIFPVLELEPVVQVNDKTRLDALKSFVSQDTAVVISDVQIDPTGSAGLISVAPDKVLDWSYGASGTFAPKLRITLSSGASAQIVSSISILSATQDHLFSTDADLVLHEADITKYVRDGRATFKDMHRRAQNVIVKWLDKQGYVSSAGAVFSKADIVNVEEVRQWAIYTTLRLIFESLSNAVDDIFWEKSKRYKGLEVEWRSKALLRLDVDGDGTADNEEGIDPKYGSVFRR